MSFSVGDVLLQVAVDPKALVVYSRLHAGCELVVQDSACLCGEGEEVSFLTLQLRAQSVGQVGIPDVWKSTEHAIRSMTFDCRHA